MTRWHSPVVLALLLASAEVPAAYGQCQTAILSNIDGTPCCTLDYFGSVLALQSDWLFVGAPNARSASNLQGAGRVYIYHRVNQSWEPWQILEATDAAGSAQFGSGVGATPDTLVVTAPGRLGGQGAAYVFARGTDDVWTAIQTLVADDTAQYRHFGTSVAISGGRLVVGAQHDSQWGQNAGAAYVFHWSDGVWTQQAKLTASDAEGGSSSVDSYAAYFGLSVDIDGNRVVVGAHGQDGVGEGSGAAYIFEYEQGMWVERTKLARNSPGEWDFFGFPVTIHGNRIAVGAYNVIVCDIRPGVVCIFEYDGNEWQQGAELVPSDAGSDDEAIYASLEGNLVLIGASNQRYPGSPDLRGAAYLFESCGDEWNEIAKLAASDTNVMGQFGRAVAIDNGTVAIGAFNSMPGRVYLYDVPGDCLTATVGSVGARYLEITANNIDPQTPVSIEVRSEECPCSTFYVDTYGFLSASTTTRPAGEWGTIHVADSEVVPGATYSIAFRAGSQIGRWTDVTTWKWGDAQNDGVVNLDDILCVLRGFGGDFGTCSLYGVDLIGSFFNPDRAVHLDDILAVLGAFSGGTYTASLPCP